MPPEPARGFFTNLERTFYTATMARAWIEAPAEWGLTQQHIVKREREGYVVTEHRTAAKDGFRSRLALTGKAPRSSAASQVISPPKTLEAWTGRGWLLVEADRVASRRRGDWWYRVLPYGMRTARWLPADHLRKPEDGANPHPPGAECGFCLPP